MSTKRTLPRIIRAFAVALLVSGTAVGTAQDDPSGPAPAPNTGTAETKPDAGDRPGSDWALFANAPPDYRPGRGLVTMEGVSGLFMNPTSGTLPAGHLTLQYCLAALRKNDDNTYQHTAMLSYGVTDWLELGLLGRLNDPPSASTTAGGGPLARVRVLRDAGWAPELSLGGMIRAGNERVDKYTAFIATSKYLPIRPEGVVRGLRVHLGFRQIWQDAGVNEANASILYGGGELELPFDVYAVAEVSTRSGVFDKTPYSFGLQWRPNHVLGLSLAGVQTGGEDRVSLFAGIGATLAF